MGKAVAQDESLKNTENAIGTSAVSTRIAALWTEEEEFLSRSKSDCSQPVKNIQPGAGSDGRSAPRTEGIIEPVCAEHFTLLLMRNGSGQRLQFPEDIVGKILHGCRSRLYSEPPACLMISGDRARCRGRKGGSVEAAGLFRLTHRCAEGMEKKR